jgi:hypothetical protein
VCVWFHQHHVARHKALGLVPKPTLCQGQAFISYDSLHLLLNSVQRAELSQDLQSEDFGVLVYQGEGQTVYAGLGLRVMV